ncbi:deuterosome assembly protein 1 isoform X3 [Mirounga angustirostris]|uniref:deuterosome assembly protein 1 isoform X4 n=1 Tax=Mirounga leonina TaxID=9715 RepID=UPI00156BF285|nr:deuterosome assembly protein 1 isoform X4 [Mirounga leonina]XP_045750562.1 deuterosome assembly protein 1 isoform X6 [Mirounga angustirostris]
MQHFLDMENQAHNMMGASPCEAELQELMEQIDIMVSNKKLDWERKMRALETRLDLRDQELANAQTCLDQKGQEVGLLRQKLDSLEKCNLAMTQNYEGQLQTLKAQFSKLTNSFEKLRLHQMKQSKVRRKELPHLKEETPFEMSNLNQKLEAMEAGLSEVKSELQSRDDLLRIIEMERLQLHRELLKIGECQNTQESKKRLESSYSPSTKEPERKRKELFSVTLDQPNHEKELNKIRSQLYQEEEYHGSEQERMRNEISDLTEELHQKEITIATIMKKAALLERQLKMELEIKEKMLAKQQVSDMRYKAVRTENTHLKGMMGDLDPGRYMTNEITDTKSMDFTNREHSRHTSINKLEYENERLRNDLAKLHANGKSAWANQNAYEEMGLYTYQNQIKMEKHEDRLSQDREPNRSVTPPLPPLPFQTKEMTSPLASDDEVFPLSPPDTVFPASLAAQHFLLEEEKRAKEFEKLLNTHIDELQRHTEFTLNKYTKLKQNRHI